MKKPDFEKIALHACDKVFGKSDISKLYVGKLSSQIILILVGIAMSIMSCYFMIAYSSSEFATFVLFSISVLCLISSAILVKELLFVMKDYPAYKKREYKKLCGKVVDFCEFSGMDDRSGKNRMCPKVQPEGSDEIIIFSVGEILTLGETYEFLYLEYTHVAQIVPHYDDSSETPV